MACLALFSWVVYTDIEKIYSFLSGNRSTLYMGSFSQRAAASNAVSKMMLIVMDVPIDRFYKCAKYTLEALK